MSPTKYTTRFRRQRKVLLLAPIVLIPLLTMFFVSLNGGREPENAKADIAPHGINVSIPPAHVKEEKGVDKMALYKKAQIDSVHTADRLKAAGMNGPDSNQTKVSDKLATVKEALSRVTATQSYQPNPVIPMPKKEPDINATSIARLERMMQSMKDGAGESNPEMEALNKTLDKLIATQHPGVPPDTAHEKRVALAVTPAMTGDGSTGWPQSSGTNRFHDLDGGEGAGDVTAPGMMEALVPESQTLVNGALIRLELTTELAIRGERIVAGTSLFGTCRLANERLMISIPAIRYREKVYPVALQVLDQDGLAGIYAPGSMTKETVRESAGQSLGSLAPGSLDPSIGGQAAGAGLQMARSLIGKKVRQAKVSVAAGYRVFLEDLSQKH